MSLQDIALLGNLLAQFLALFTDCFHGVKARRLLATYVRGLLSSERESLSSMNTPTQMQLAWSTKQALPRAVAKLSALNASTTATEGKLKTLS